MHSHIIMKRQWTYAAILNVLITDQEGSRTIYPPKMGHYRMVKSLKTASAIALSNLREKAIAFNYRF